MGLAKQYRDIYFRIGRLRLYRFASWHREISVQWSDGREPECFRVLFTLFACRHRKRVQWRDDYSGVQGNTCAQCLKQFDYSLTDREIFRKFVTRRNSRTHSIYLYRKNFLGGWTWR